MERQITLKLLGPAALHQAFGQWRRSLHTNSEDQRRFGRTFLDIMIKDVVKDLGQDVESYFIKEITSGTVFEGYARRRANRVTLYITDIRDS